MKKLLLSVLAAVALLPCATQAETINVNGKDYATDVLIEREIGPGIHYKRLRMPTYPLNINMVMVDLNNPYNRIETTTANESAKGTELLVKAAQRQSSVGHRALAGANANFWIVATQPEERVYLGTTRNANVRNGKMVTESNQFKDQWDGGTMRTGVVAVDYDKTAHVDYCTATIKITADAFGTIDVHQCNKGAHPDEICMYNSFYGSSRSFMPISDDYNMMEAGDATEVILDLNEGEQWTGGNDIHFTVKEVRLDAGKGTLGNHDLALMGRGENRARLAGLKAGDQLTLKYNWTFDPNGNAVTPLVEQAVGGNALVMCHGELTAHNTNETYNKQVYSRTGYGCSQDGKTLYIIVIDKSNDPVYGNSAGCGTSVMCEIARHYGCYNMANFDAGGSAEMFIDGAVINRTTESSPRAVANGFLVYSIAPEDDNTITRLEFDDVTLQAPVYSSYTPKMLGYNKYGALVDKDVKGFTLSTEAATGSCEGDVFTAAGEPCTGTLTATLGDVSVSKSINVMEAEVSIRIKNLMIDHFRSYPMEVTATVGSNEYKYNPASIEWTVEDPNIVTIDHEGVLRGVNQGTTKVTGRIGSFVDECEVTVESSAVNKKSVDLTGWTGRGSSGITNVSVDADGVVHFTYGAPRGPYVQVAGDVVFASLPDSVVVKFTPSIPVVNVQADFRSAQQTRSNSVKIVPANGTQFEAGKEHSIELPIEELGDPSDLIIYPLSLHYLRFSTATNSSYKGAQTIKINDLYAYYDHITSGVNDIAMEGGDSASSASVAIRCTEGGRLVKVSSSIALSRVALYSVSGRMVAEARGTGAGTLAVKAPAAGVYVVAVSTPAGVATQKIVVK